ncbi:MAG: response regulator [bacterium]|nr:response regulator [bacterium]
MSKRLIKTVAARLIFWFCIINLVFFLVCFSGIYYWNNSMLPAPGTLALILGGLLLLNILTAIFFSGTITGPLKSMIVVSKKIQAGNHEVRNCSQKYDEFAILADAFNGMADSVISHSYIQQKCFDIIGIMVSTIDLEEFSSIVLEKFMELTKGDMGAFYDLSDDEKEFIHRTSVGINSYTIKRFNSAKVEGEFGRALATREITLTETRLAKPYIKSASLVGRPVSPETMLIPVVMNDKTVALITIAGCKDYSSEVLSILNRVRPVLNTAFSNILAIEVTKRLARKLLEKNAILVSQKDALKYQADELAKQTTQVREQSAEMECQKLKVEEASRLKSEFLSNMSHELRTPLNSILSLSRLFLRQGRKKLSQDESHYLEIIVRNGEKLLALINDILDLSKIEAGKINLKPKEISIRSVVDMIVENHEVQAEEKGIELEAVFPNELPVIESDEPRLFQVLQNIIGNAVKFTEEGEVRVLTSYDDDTVTIVVADTGIGIADEDRAHIFDEFRQIDGTFSRKFEGTGLGLTIALKSAEMISGDIRVESTLGKGTTFNIRFPRQWQDRVLSRSSISIEETEEWSAHIPEDEDPGLLAPESAQGNNQEKIRIMIIEDDPDNMTTIQAVLQSKYDTLSSYNGEEGLEIIKKELPDLVLLDIDLPGISGLAVVKEIKKDERLANIPVIAFTALSMRGDRERILKAGCNDYISKPYNIEELLDKIDKWLRIDND